MEIGTGVLELEVSMAVELLLSGGILLATSDVTGEFGTMAGFTGVSGSGVADIVDCSGVLCIPWLFLEGLSDPVVMFMFIHRSVLSYASIIL